MFAVLFKILYAMDNFESFKFESLKDSDCSSYQVNLMGVQISLLTTLLESICNGTLILDSKKFHSFDVPPSSYYRMAAWNLLHYFQCLGLIHYPDV